MPRADTVGWRLLLVVSLADALRSLLQVCAIDFIFRFDVISYVFPKESVKYCWFVYFYHFLFVPKLFDDLLIIFIKIYATNFGLHVVTSLLCSKECGYAIYFLFFSNVKFILCFFLV